MHSLGCHGVQQPAWGASQMGPHVDALAPLVMPLDVHIVGAPTHDAAPAIGWLTVAIRQITCAPCLA